MQVGTALTGAASSAGASGATCIIICLKYAQYVSHVSYYVIRPSDFRVPAKSNHKQPLTLVV